MSRQTILIVDDEQPIRHGFSRALGKPGYAVRTAESGEAALKLMRADPAQLVFLDLNMPGMNGLEVCRAIRAAWPWTITIAVTGYASLFELVDCREAGFEDYFLKPVSMADLLAAAHSAFQKIHRWRQR